MNFKNTSFNTIAYYIDKDPTKMFAQDPAHP